MKLDSLPSGARVVQEADGIVLGQTPYEGKQPRSGAELGLKLELDGYKPKSVRVSLSADFARAYELEKRGGAESARPRHTSRVAPPAAPASAAAASTSVPVAAGRAQAGASHPRLGATTRRSSGGLH